MSRKLKGTGEMPAGRLKLKIALERYDRHFPFFDNTVTSPAGVEFEVLQVGQSVTLRDGTGRHERMLHGKEFDLCEFSMSSYLMAKGRGMNIAGVPVFPRRLFSASQMFVHPDSSIEHPRDLIGKKVAVSSFQNTLSFLAKGDLKFEYGVPWEEVKWFVQNQEKVSFKKKPGVAIEPIAKDQDLGVMLERGELDALFFPHPPHSVMAGKTRARRLFRDTRAEELRYFRKNGYYPIMHLLAISAELAEREPWLPTAIMQCYAQAKDLAASYFEDPGWSQLAWGRHYFEEEKKLFGADPWPIGLKANYKNLERFIEYSHDQNLLESRIAVESLFPQQVLDT
jgi:4,5-dihydroxyphthalate decarboxylase